MFMAEEQGCAMALAFEEAQSHGPGELPGTRVR
jgi:hypothetical protein